MERQETGGGLGVDEMKSSGVAFAESPANRRPDMQSQPLWLAGPAYVVAYVAMVWVSLAFASTPFGIVPWGPETGLSFAAFFVLGKRIWPFMVVAVAAADLIVRGHDFPLAAQIFAPIIIGGGYAIALTILANPMWRFDPALHTFRDVQLLEATAIVSSILIALGYAAVLVVTGILPRAESWTCRLRVCDRRPHRHFRHRAILAASARIWARPASHAREPHASSINTRGFGPRIWVRVPPALPAVQCRLFPDHMDRAAARTARNDMGSLVYSNWPDSGAVSTGQSS